VFGEIPLARGALKLTPGAAIGMAIGPQIVHPQPAPIVTLGVGTNVHRGVHGTGAPVCWRHGSRPWRGRGRRLAGLPLTQGTVRLVRQTRERFGLSRTLTLGLEGRGWHGRRGLASPRPVERQHDEEPEESQQSELVVKQV
jgi:hypothetical protein